MRGTERDNSTQLMQAAYTIYNWSVKGIFNTIKHCRSIVNKSAPQQHAQSKIDRFIQLQSAWQDKLAKLAPALPGQKTIWFHASSLGEFQIARPIIARLKKETDFRIISTFFSCTALDALKGAEGRADTPDIILPLPLDTRENANLFIDKITPDLAIFMVSEFWPNFLDTLNKREIPTLLYSGLFRPKLHNLVGSAFRNSMVAKFDMVTVHDEASLKYIRSIGCKNSVLVPDPLFDNALCKKEEPYEKETLKRFCHGARDVLVAGSIHLDKDLEMIASLAERYPDTKFIVVPHEISTKGLAKIKGAMPGKTVLYSENKIVKDWKHVQCLVIDFIGALAKIYRYGTAAYVGGGFTPLLHSVIEPLVYGIPVAYGPKTGRKYITDVMKRCGIGTVVSDNASIGKWWEDISSHKENLKEIKNEADILCSQNIGGAEHAVGIIKKMIEK